MANLDGYCDTVTGHELPLDHVDCLAREQAARERLVFGLRMMAGVSTEDLHHWGSTHSQWNENLNRMKAQGLLTEEKGYLKLTEMGYRYADTVAVALL